MNDNAPDTVAALMPKSRRITLAETEYTITPLTIRQIVGLMRLAGDFRPLEPSTDQKGMLFALLAQAGPKLPEVLGILLGNGEPDAAFVERCAGLTLEDVASLAVAVAEVNDFGKLQASFTVAVAKIKAGLEAGTASASPSA